MPVTRDPHEAVRFTCKRGAQLRASIQIDSGSEVLILEEVKAVWSVCAAMREDGRIAEVHQARRADPHRNGEVERVNHGSLPERELGTQTLSEHRCLLFLPIGRETWDQCREIFVGDWLGDWSLDQCTALVCDGKLDVSGTTVHRGVPWEGGIMRDHRVLERAQSFDLDSLYARLVQVALKGAHYGHPFYGAIAISTTDVYDQHRPITHH